MTDARKHAPEIYLQTALSINGSQLLEQSGVISANRFASGYDMARIEKYAADVLKAVADYRQATAASAPVALRPAIIRGEDSLPDTRSESHGPWPARGSGDEPEVA